MKVSVKNGKHSFTGIFLLERFICRSDINPNPVTNQIIKYYWNRRRIAAERI